MQVDALMRLRQCQHLSTCIVVRTLKTDAAAGSLGPQFLFPFGRSGGEIALKGKAE